MRFLLCSMRMWSKKEMLGNYRVQLNVCGYEFYGQAELPQQAKHNAATQVLFSEKTADRLQWMAYRTSEREEFSSCFSSQAQYLDRKGVAQCRNTVLRIRILDPVPFLTPGSAGSGIRDG